MTKKKKKKKLGTLYYFNWVTKKIVQLSKFLETDTLVRLNPEKIQNLNKNNNKIGGGSFYLFIYLFIHLFIFKWVKQHLKAPGLSLICPNSHIFNINGLQYSLLFFFHHKSHQKPIFTERCS